MFLIIGIMLFTYYQHVPLPVRWRATTSCCRPSSSRRCPMAPRGFIVAAIVAAALSPSINAMAATTVNDFYAKLT